MNILFKADLSKYVAHRPSVLYWVMQPGADVGGIGMGLVRMVRPWNEWLIVWGYDINQPAPKVDDAFATKVARDLVGDPDLEIEIQSVSTWTVNNMYATQTSKRPRVLHGRRHPSPSAVQRARLQHLDPGRASTSPGSSPMCSRARPAPKLLDSYSAGARADRQADRHPRQPVDRGVRPDLQGARPARFDRPGEDAAQHGCALRRHAGGRRAARRDPRGDRLQGLRVRRPWRRDEPALPVRAPIVTDGQTEPAFERGCRAALPADHLARRAAAACLGVRIGRRQGIRRSTWPAMAGSPCSPASAARPGSRPRKARRGTRASTSSAHLIGPRQPWQDLSGDWARAREIRDSGVPAGAARPACRLARSEAMQQRPDGDLRKALDVNPGQVRA